MTIDQHIEELRAELKACLDDEEFGVIQAELQAVLTERARLESTLETWIEAAK